MAKIIVVAILNLASGSYTSGDVEIDFVADSFGTNTINNVIAINKQVPKQQKSAGFSDFEPNKHINIPIAKNRNITNNPSPIPATRNNGVSIMSKQ